MSVVGFCMCPSFCGLFSHGSQPTSNGPRTLPIILAEVFQNTSLAAKLNKGGSAHSSPRGRVPAQGFETKSALPDAYPPVPETGHFDSTQQEYGRRVSFAERLEQRELFVEVFSGRCQYQLSVFTDLMVASELEAFHEWGEFLC